MGRSSAERVIGWLMRNGLVGRRCVLGGSTVDVQAVGRSISLKMSLLAAFVGVTHDGVNLPMNEPARGTA